MTARLENRERQHRQVDGAQQVADVVARALIGNLLRLVRGRGGRRHEELHQPLVAIADRPAVHFEDVAELHPAIGADRPDQQQIRLQLAVFHALAGPICVVGGNPDDDLHVLDVVFLRDDAGELLLQVEDVGAGAVEHGVERRRWLGRGVRDERRGDASRDDHGAQALHFLTGATLSSVCT